MYRLRYISKGMLASLSLAVVIAFTISLLPNSQVFDLYQDLTVFNQRKQIELNNNNIVDFVSPFSGDMQIKRVIWEQNILSIDFYINNNSNVDTARIYRDFYNVIKKSFLDYSNVKEVLIRVFIGDFDKIFVAVSAQKNDIISNPKMELEPTMMYKEFLEKYFGLNYGNILKQY